MATFYLLPPRHYLGERLAEYLASWFPGLALPASRELADAVGATISQAGVYVVHREDLPDGEDADRALVNGFGAEIGDEVIEVRAGAGPGQLATRRWRVG